MIVGLTGGIGSGKSTVCKMFASLGAPIISADQIAKQIVDSDHAVLQQIIDKFGDQYLTANHTLDRRKLKNMIFMQPQQRLWLEKLLHPLIIKEIQRQTKEIEYPYCIVEIPILVEAGFQNIVDRILTIDSPVQLQLKRAMERDQHNKIEIENIIANQITREGRLAVTDDIIDNSTDLNSLEAQVYKLHNLYLQQSML